MLLAVGAYVISEKNNCIDQGAKSLRSLFSSNSKSSSSIRELPVNEDIKTSLSSNLINIDKPLAGKIVHSPLSVTGQARGFWFFEGSFPITIYDSEDNELGSTTAIAQSEWMTSDFVNFTATLSFHKPSTETGYIVFKKDKPSALADNDQELILEVNFDLNAPIVFSTLSYPINKMENRVNKKPFGVHVSPESSPVEVEKFTGYHTGVDFEIWPEEEDLEIPIFTICDGKVVYKDYVNGYGGVLVQSCLIDGEKITALYGHLKLSSIAYKVNDELRAGKMIGVLGEGYSSETSGERKHLHLGLHKGEEVDFRGYVQTLAELDEWIDFMKNSDEAFK